MNDGVLPLRDRASAGRALARRVAALGLVPAPIVLALPRGGVPVAAEVARSLGAPLDVLVVRKIGAPYQRELAVAAVVESDTGPLMVVDDEIARDSGAGREWIEAQAAVEWREIERRQALYRQGRPAPAVAGRAVVVVDDGIATGTTVRAALKALRQRGAARVVLAVPVAPDDTLAQLRREADDVVCLAVPSPFIAIGCHYEDFHQLSDEEVLSGLSLQRAR